MLRGRSASGSLSKRTGLASRTCRCRSPRHAYQFRLAASRWIVLRHVRATVLSGWVRIRLPWFEGVVTWFVTDFRTRSSEQGA